MNKKILYGLVALIAGTSVQAQDEAAVQKEIELAREVISQYVDTRQRIAEAKNKWKAYKEITQRRISLYNQEIKGLEGEIKEAEESTTQAEREIAKIRDEIRVLKDATAVVSKALPAYEDKLRELSQYFPKPLKDKLSSLTSQLGKSKQPSDRMAILVGIMNEVDKFNSDFNISSTHKTLPGGETKLVDVIYLGLAVAYYADSDGIVGGIGTPAAGEWTWAERNDLAPAIRDAVLYYNGDIKPAMMVDLPVEIHNISVGN